MCGVFLVVDHSLGIHKNQKIEALNLFKYRGPNNTDYVNFEKFFLGHHRLSIRDLSNNSNQPKYSLDKKFLISYNGELYNTVDLLKNLTANNIKINNINSDTEILINYISCFGISKTLMDIKGMFAFICIDINQKKVYACRDPFGEKPLYIYGKNKNFVITSDIVSFEKLNIPLEISNYSYDIFLRLSYVPSPYSIYNNIYKLNAGELIEINIDIDSAYEDCKKIKYFKVEDFQRDLSPTDDLVHKKIFESVESQLVSDVDVGTFLSGGIDSSLITAIASKINPKISSFTIGFKDKYFDESNKAKLIANKLGIKNYNKTVTQKDLLECIDDMHSIYSEPFADSSQIPTFLLTKFSKNYIDVALTGDGGDELFAGYNRYVYLKKYNKIIFMPFLLKYLLKSIIEFLPIHEIKKNKILKNLLNVNNLNNYYLSIIDNVGINNRITNLSHNPLIKLYDNIEIVKSNDILNLQILDLIHYLPNDILVKIDRASMFNGLETRAPFLNKEIFHLALNLKNTKKISFFSGGKVQLKNILKKYIGNELTSSSKKGFGIPIYNWLRGDLNEWAKSLINSNFTDHLIDMNFIKKKFTEHEKYKMDNSALLWNFLIFQSWYQKKFT